MEENELLKTENFLINLRYFSKMIERKMTSCLKKNNVDISEFIYLTLLGENPDGLSMMELTNLSKVDKSMTTKVIKKLEQKSYIYRDRETISTRNYKIRLTELGKEKSQTIRELLFRARVKFEEKFTKEERELLLNACNCVLHKYIENDN